MFFGVWGDVAEDYIFWAVFWGYGGQQFSAVVGVDALGNVIAGRAGVGAGSW